MSGKSKTQYVQIVTNIYNSIESLGLQVENHTHIHIFS